MGKKQKKPGKGKEKTERKTAKATEKRTRREDKLVSEEDDIDAILAKIQKEEAKKVAVQVDENVPAPSPRCNGSMTVNPLKDTELIFYGGEYYNGDKTFVYGDLYRYNVEKGDWKLVSSPNSPPPRSAHQAVAWKNSLFIFGGEYTSVNQEKFHHYKDLWKLDLNTNVWEQLNLKGAPSPRSGHRMVLYKHKLIIFGGFYDTLREVRYYNDLHVLDLDDYKWQEIKPKPGAAWPTPRSAFQFASYQDEVFLYGGYYKDAISEKDGTEKGVVHADMWVLDPRTMEWNKVKKQGMPPGPRAGFSMCIHKKRAILFGGVVDTEEKDIIRSTFMNEMYAFQMDNRRWFPLELRRPKVPKGKARGQSGPAKSKKQKSNGGTTNVEEVIAANDDDFGMDIENDDVNIRETEGLAKRIEDTVVIDDTDSGSLAQLSAPAELEPQIVKPCARINSLMVVGRDTLYLYGGVMEVGEREVTLDDLYTMDLNKLDAWNLVIEATETDWVEVGDDEDDDDDDDDEDGEDDDEDDDDDDDEEDDNQKAGSSTLTPAEAAAAILRGEGKKLQRKDRKAEIARIRAELGLADAARTPAPGESLKVFFARTNMYWQLAAYEHTQHTGKELRKDGFDLADGRYRELRPVLDELEKLEAEQKAIEAEEAKTLATRKGKDKAKRAAR